MNDSDIRSWGPAHVGRLAPIFDQGEQLQFLRPENCGLGAVSIFVSC
jgi:hypothetical protein